MNQSIGVLAELKWTLALTACLALFGCGKPDSPADQVRQAIEKLEAAAETRDISDFKAGIADSFRDREGRDTAQIANLVHGYFVLNQSIHLLTRITALNFRPRTRRE